MSDTNMKTDVAPGDKVSWNWGGGNPSGTAEEVKPNDTTITTHRGNEVKKTGSSEDPAVKLSMGSGKSAVKQAHELNVEKEGPNHDKAGKIEEKDGGKSGDDGLKAPAAGRGKSKSPAPAKEKKEPAAAKEKKEPAKKADKPAAEKKAEEPKKAEEKKEESKPAASEEKKEPAKRGRKPAAASEAKAGEKKPAAGGKKEKCEKPKKRAATESGEPRRSKRTKA